jgi:hypothetical protein
MQAAYAKAFFSRPPTVFGLALRPFSIGHSFLLEAIENPVAMGLPYSPQDAAVFAAVCSLPFAEAWALLNDQDAGRAKMEALGEANQGADWRAECAKIDEYFQSACDCIPERWEKDGDGDVRVPIQLAFFHVLRGTAPITPELEAQLWDMPYGRAMIYAAVSGWAKGDETLMTQEEEEKYNAVLQMAPPEVADVRT